MFKLNINITYQIDLDDLHMESSYNTSSEIKQSIIFIEYYITPILFD